MKTRLWLMFQPRLVTQPVIYELGRKFNVVTNVRQASVNEEIGLMSVELDGERTMIEQAIAWLEELGVKVEPVEINTIEGDRLPHRQVLIEIQRGGRIDLHRDRGSVLYFRRGDGHCPADLFFRVGARFG